MDVLEADVAAQPARLDRLGRVGDGVVRVEDREHLLERHARGLERAVHAGEPLHGREEAAEVAEDRDERADRHLAAEDERAARPRR